MKFLMGIFKKKKNINGLGVRLLANSNAITVAHKTFWRNLNDN